MPSLRRPEAREGHRGQKEGNDLISNGTSNQFLNRVQVLPLTTNVERLYPSEAYASVKGQRRKAMADQLTRVSKERLSSKLRELGHLDLEWLERAILLQLGISS